MNCPPAVLRCSGLLPLSRGSHPSRVPGFWLGAFVLVLLGALPAHARSVDANTNGMSDIWELTYGAGSLDPNADTDHDGVINRLEAIAGTNPFDSNAYPRIAFGAHLGTNFTVTLSAALGKAYGLQSVSNLADITGTNWVLETNVVARSGSTVTLTAPASGTARFFRLSIADTNTDGSPLTDWEKYLLGLDPFNAYSNGHLDGNGNPLSDYAFVTGKLASQNVVSIAATDPTAVEPDAGQFSTSPGQFTLTRGGFPLNSITVSMGLGGPGAGFANEGLDHASLPRTLVLPAGVGSLNIPLTPLANPNLLASVIAQYKVLPGTGYSIVGSNSASVVIYPSPTPNGTGLTGFYYTNANTTYSSLLNFNNSNLKVVRVDPTVDFVWGNPTNPIPNNGYYCVRWVGQVEPQYSETYYFVANTDDGVKLWVNDQLIIDNWTTHGAADSVGSITLQGGTRYNLKLEYFQGTGSAVAHLSWYSPSQSKQIIPSNRLFPTNAVPGPGALTSPISAVAFLGQPFSFTVTAANSPLSYTATNLPPGLSFNTTNGVISGIPTLAGNFQATLTASNASGVSASAVNLQVLNTGSAVTREVWLNVPGVAIADIPVDMPANLTNALGGLEGITDYGDNYAERVRGYFTAPVTGNYYFWVAGSDSVEFWLSNDGDPVNKVRRAYVLPTVNPGAPPANGTGSRQWKVQPSQISGWLALVAGQQYYVEVLHKAGAGSGDNWSVGWLLDPTGTNRTPAGVTPGYLLSRFFPPPPSTIPGTLYSANLQTLPGVMSMASGTASLRVSADGSQAVLSFELNNLSSPVASMHIDSDPYLNNPAQLVYDISAAKPQADGTYLWKIKDTGTLKAADILEIILEGKASINVHTGDYPNGELSGHFTPADGAQTFTPPPPPPTWADDSSNPNAAARFLTQATYGSSAAEIAHVQAQGYANWLTEQMSLPPTHMLPLVLANKSADPTTPFPSTLWFNTWWRQSVTAPDQLRQRVAFALSEIMVVSEDGVLQNNATALASYYDMLLDNAFGNYRNLLRAVTLHPAMGLYLNMQGNDAGSIITGVHANENYAREIQQLFSVGLNRLWPDGPPVLNAQGNLVPTYGQNEIMGFASVFTGWNYYQANQGNGRLPTNWRPSANYTNPMVLVPTHHELGPKLVLDNVMLPPAWGTQSNPASSDFDAYCAQDLESALDSIYNHPSVGPYICRQLIQRLVTSNPSRNYLYRVVQAFNNNGAGVRGDLSAVIRAILLDYEARSPELITQPTYGKQREPLLRVTAAARAFAAPPPNGGTYSQNGLQVISITTSNAHRHNNGDTVFLSFTDSSGKPTPPTQGYSVTVTGPSSFNVNAPGMTIGSYGQTNGTLTLTLSGNGVAVGNPVYLGFSTGGASSGVYTVATVVDTSHFRVSTSDMTLRYGTCFLPKLTGGGFVVQNKTNLTVVTTLMHGLNPGDSVYLNFNSSGSPADGQYTVASVPDPTHFTAIVSPVSNQTQNGLTTYPLVAPVLIRSGLVGVQESTWNMGYTDTGSSSSLSQSPLSAPTVFNFFYPNYQFPGQLAAAGLTTPEFQLTSDTSVALCMNFLEGSILGNTGNTNGLSSFTGGNGAIVLDLGPWMTPSYTSAAGAPSLVEGLNTLLLAGQLSTAAKANILSYVTNTANFSYSNPPTNKQMRDRVRATVHLILTSPDFTIQK